ncbi:hypothetical protein [Amycolatopsis saalfeldensis]|uniref:Uncharacterized protein n=1 Tax=Amycolatopsis saalfeldensis TaxID=394193 RepID=A0A1H8T5Z8_9PSEU|nr:hypothetical protein [Amycolatopsis saalfeldensis]SEO85958.1 hypothetical protein SAMN04489732_102430 [Amycolatopsis saalfeldensis]
MASAYDGAQSVLSPSCAVWYDTSFRPPDGAGPAGCRIVATSAIGWPRVSSERYFTCQAWTGTGRASARTVTGRESSTAPGGASGNGAGWA